MCLFRVVAVATWTNKHYQLHRCKRPRHLESAPDSSAAITLSTARCRSSLSPPNSTRATTFDLPFLTDTFMTEPQRENCFARQAGSCSDSCRSVRTSPRMTRRRRRESLRLCVLLGLGSGTPDRISHGSTVQLTSTGCTELVWRLASDFADLLSLSSVPSRFHSVGHGSST